MPSIFFLYEFFIYLSCICFPYNFMLQESGSWFCWFGSYKVFDTSWIGKTHYVPNVNVFYNIKECKCILQYKRKITEVGGRRYGKEEIKTRKWKGQNQPFSKNIQIWTRLWSALHNHDIYYNVKQFDWDIYVKVKVSLGNNERGTFICSRMRG